MKVRVTFTVEVGEDERRAINKQYAQPGLASREEVREWFMAYGLDVGMQQISTILYYETEEE